MKKLDLSALCQNTVVQMVTSPKDHFRTVRFYIRRGNRITTINPGAFALWCREHHANYKSIMSVRSSNPSKTIYIMSKEGHLLYTLLPKNFSL